MGPILASVISLAITGTVTLDAFMITFAYSLGTAVPLFLVMAGAEHVAEDTLATFKHRKNSKVFGVVMIVTAIGIFLTLTEHSKHIF